MCCVAPLGLYNVMNLETNDIVTVEIFSDEMIKKDGKCVLYKEWIGEENDYLKVYNSLASFGTAFGFWKMANEYGEDVIIGFDGGKSNIHLCENYVNSYLELAWKWYLDSWHYYNIKRRMFGCPSISRDIFGRVADFCAQKVHPTAKRNGELLAECLYQFLDVAAFLGMDISEVQCNMFQIRYAIRRMTQSTYHQHIGREHKFCIHEEYWLLQLKLEDYVENDEYLVQLVKSTEILLKELNEKSEYEEEDKLLKKFESVIKNIEIVEIESKRERFLISRFIQSVWLVRNVVPSDVTYSLLNDLFQKPTAQLVCKALDIREYRSAMNKEELINLLIDSLLEWDKDHHEVFAYLDIICSNHKTIRNIKFHSFMEENNGFQVADEYVQCVSYFAGEFKYCPRVDLMRIKEIIGSSLNEAWNSWNNDACEKGEKHCHLIYEGLSSVTYFEWKSKISMYMDETARWLDFVYTPENFHKPINGESPFSAKYILKKFADDPFSCYDKWILDYDDKFVQELTKREKERKEKLTKLTQEEKDKLCTFDFIYDHYE